MFALVDCNNFYASCERVFNPALEGKPIVILSSNDGCVIARSEEAKAIGIEMGIPAFMIEDFLVKHGVIVFSSNYTLYGDFSSRVMKLLAGFSPRLEVYSIDEAFLDLSELKFQDLQQLAGTIRKTIMQYTGIPVSIGIAPTKTLAKMANRVAKKKKKESGVHLLGCQEEIDQVLKFTSVENVWGIGRQSERLLRQNNITTAYELCHANEEWIRKNLSVVGQRMLNELRGIPCIDWVNEDEPKKEICTARSFGQVLTEKKDIAEALANYASNCASKLRQQNSCADAMHVFIQTNVHRTQDQQVFHSIDLRLPVPTNSTNEIIRHALKGLDIIFQPGYHYKKVGVIVRNLVPDSEIQSGLFDVEARHRNNVMMTALDKVNKAFGREMVRFAVQGYERKWKLRQQRLSPCYTTNIDQLLTIKN